MLLVETLAVLARSVAGLVSLVMIHLRNLHRLIVDFLELIVGLLRIELKWERFVYGYRSIAVPRSKGAGCIRWVRAGWRVFTLEVVKGVTLPGALVKCGMLNISDDGGRI